MRHVVLFSLAYFMLAGVTLAGEDKVLFEDSFDGKLADGWTWLRQSPDGWRIKDDALEIRVEPGVAHTVKKALLRKAPDRSQVKHAVLVTVTFTAPPTQQYEQAGITWYHEKKPVFKLVHERIDGELWIIPGRRPAPAKTVQLRLVVDGNKWIAQFRETLDGEFKTAETGELPPPGDDIVSLQCYNGPADSEHWMRFDDFRMVELKE